MSRLTEEQTVRILEVAVSGQKAHAQLCKEHGVSLGTLYIWKRKDLGHQTEDLRQMRKLKPENARLKSLLAEWDLKIGAVRTLFRKSE